MLPELLLSPASLPPVRLPLLGLGIALSVVLLLAAPLSTSASFMEYCCRMEEQCIGRGCTLGPTGHVSLSCDNPNSNGAGSLLSRDWFHFGLFSVSMKLPKGYSGGVVPALFLRSGPWPANATAPTADAGAGTGGQGKSGAEAEAETRGGVEAWGNHTRITWEFLGGEHPRNITLHTNLFAERYQHLHQFKLPLDPSETFHTYSIRWNAVSIAWMVDWTPVRILHRDRHRPWPNEPLQFQLTIGDASSWTTHRSDYERSGPVAIEVGDISLQGCRTKDPKVEAPKECTISRELSSAFPWNGPLEAWQYAAWRVINTTNLVNAWDWEFTT